MSRVISIGLFVLAIMACTTEERIESLELAVDELVCLDGQRTFEGRILELAGIRSVSVNIDHKKASVKYRNTEVTAEAILAHLSDHGFTINGERGNAAARRRLPSCCLEAGE